MAGTAPSSFKAEIINNQCIGNFIAPYRMMFNLGVIDAPPVRLDADLLIFTAKAIHVLLVVKANSTQICGVEEATTLMRRVQTPNLGVLFNYVKTTRGYGDYLRCNYYYDSYSIGKKALYFKGEKLCSRKKLLIPGGSRSFLLNTINSWLSSPIINSK